MVSMCVCVVSSCSDDPASDDDQPPPDQTEELGVSTLLATISNTRVAAGDPVDGLLPAVWSAGDRIAATNEDGIWYYELTEGADSETGVFVLEDSDKDAPKPPFDVIYPVETVAEAMTQRYVEDGFDSRAVSLSGRAEDPEGESAVSGKLAVTLTKEYAIFNLRLSGNVSVKSVSVTDEAAALMANAHTVTLDCAEGVALDSAAAKDFRLLIKPGTHHLEVKVFSDDGRVKSYSSDEAMTFDAGAEQILEMVLQAAAADFTSGPYDVGDYYFDGMSEGVVVEVDPTGSKGKLIAMHDAGGALAWGPDNVITSALDEDYGVPNMSVIAALDPSYEAYPAFRACAEWGDGWYLPAQKEMQGVRDVLDKVNSTLGWQGGSEISKESLYWSSTEADSYSDATAFAADMSLPGMFGIVKTEPLKVRAFKEFGEIPDARYKVGDMCEESGKKGVVFWVSKDGSYAKILSLAENNLQWGAVGSATGAIDEYNGENNLGAVEAADASLESYPAFRSCTEQGEGWYLPALNELTSISRMTAALNNVLSANGSPVLQSAYYWSSTELGADAANSAQCVSLADGSLLSSSKNIARNVRAVAYVGDRPVEEKTYAVGDPFEINDEIVVGIVCAVTDGGKHGTVIALNDVAEEGRINAMWDYRANEDNYILLGASDTDDGRVNMEKAKANDSGLANMPAFQLCDATGAGWYLGAVNEVKSLYENKGLLDAALEANGGSALDADDYWTSTEGAESPTERAVSVSLKDGTTSDYRKFLYLRVRPMMRF